ncbi:MAG: hypothetical protein WEB63_07295 [Cucumibacter sp.]
MRLIIAGILALAAGGAFAEEPTALKLNSTLNWSGPESDGRVFTYQGTSATLVLNWSEGAEWVDSVTFMIERPGQAPLAFDIAAGLQGYGQIGVYAMGEARKPVLVVGAFSGGAHCCEQIYLLDLSDPVAVQVDGGAYDGGTVSPVDADGDGSFEIVVPDPRFHYTFDCYACGGPPSAVFALIDGALADASANPTYRQLFVEDFNRYSEGCGASAEWNAGPCAGLLGAAARLGIYEGVRAMLDEGMANNKNIVSGWEEFRFCIDEDCATLQSFTDLGEAIDYALRQWGYLPAK